MYCFYKCSVALPHSAVDCDCDCDLQYVIVVFPDQTYLLVFIFLCSTKCLFKFCNVLDGEETAYCITLCSRCLVSVSI